MSSLLLVMSLQFYPYAYLGVGYKLNEPEYATKQIWDSSQKYCLDNCYQTEFNGVSIDDSFILELGFEMESGIKFGIKHDSQISSGAPFNDKQEYFKTEIFIGYKIGGVN